jgi:hypothetical protein
MKTAFTFKLTEVHRILTDLLSWLAISSRCGLPPRAECAVRSLKPFKIPHTGQPADRRDGRY